MPLYPPSTGGGGGWTETGAVVHLTVAANQVAIGIAAMVGAEKVRIYTDVGGGAGLRVENVPAAPAAGSGIDVEMGANSTGDGVDINLLGTGRGLFIHSGITALFSVLLTGAALATSFEATAGGLQLDSSAYGVSAVGGVRLRSNAGVLEASQNGGAYATVATGSGMAIGGSIVGGTATRVLFEGAGPVLADAATLTFNSGTGVLTATGLVASSVTDSGLTSGRVTFAGAAGLLSDSALFTYSTGAGLSAAVSDAATNTNTDALVLDHRTSGVPAANFSTGIRFVGEDAAGNADDMGRMGWRWSDATSGSEDSTWFVQNRFNGVALGDALTVNSGGMATAQRQSGVSGGFTCSVGATVEWRVQGTGGFTAQYDCGQNYRHVFQALSASFSGARGFFDITPPSNTNQTASTEISSQRSITFSRQWATGALTTQREITYAAPTYSFVGASTITTSVMLAVLSAPIAGTNATITNSIALLSGGDVSIGPTTAGMTYAAHAVPAHTVTVTGATAVTSAQGFAAIALGIITVSDASAMTMTNASTLYIAGAPVGGGAGPVTITNAYAIWVDGGACRFDGNMGFFSTAPVAQQTGPTVNITNNVTAGGVDGTVANYTDLVVYANDAAAIRNDIYQLARAIKFASDGLRAYGLLT